MARVMEITTRIGCRQACTSCPQSSHTKGWSRLIEAARQSRPSKSFDRMMSLATFKTCLDKIPRDVQIFFAGSVEPYLNPDCTAMILYAHEKGYQMRLYTT